MRLFVDNLTNVDFSYMDASRGVVGETWLANIELRGELDAQGMVVDFGVVKKTLRDWLDDILDHRLLIPRHANNLTMLEEGDSPAFSWNLEDGQRIRCKSPASAFTFIDAESITPESVAKWSQEQLRNTFPATVEQLTLDFSCEEIPHAFYHYSHGLKKHLGNCQRIAHGHRSRINIWVNDELRIDLMQQWARAWEDIYIGTKEDLVPHAKTTDDAIANDHYAFAYRAQQGDFSLEIPKSRCYLIDTDSTVELIAAHIAAQVKASLPEDHIKVQAFEGIGKGAIVEN